jgi:prepilin-type N-terminal cleavage/methylation domain-containing protein
MEKLSKSCAVLRQFGTAWKLPSYTFVRRLLAMRTAQLSRTQSGFTLVEIMVVVAIVGVLATIAVCNFISARDSSRLQIIRHNLAKIEVAKEQWALEKKQPTGAPVADITVLSDYFRSGTVKSVVQETYQPNAIGDASEAILPATVAVGPYTAGGSIPAP